MSQLLLSWLFAASLALAVAAGGVRAGRRRNALNEALHELRRPLHSLSLAAPASGVSRELDLSLRMATAALERLEQEINGGVAPQSCDRLSIRPLLREAVERWRGAVARAGGSARLSWRGPEAIVRGDREELARAFDNLIANALEHGGAEIAVTATVTIGTLRIVVADPGRDGSPGWRRSSRAGFAGRLGGRGRRGHGLRIVRRVATDHRGRFRLRRTGGGAEAVLELPLDRSRAR